MIKVLVKPEVIPHNYSGKIAVDEILEGKVGTVDKVASAEFARHGRRR